MEAGELPNRRTHLHLPCGEEEDVCKGCDTHLPFRAMNVNRGLSPFRRGTEHAGNFQMLCSGCNRCKGGGTVAEP